MANNIVKANNIDESKFKISEAIKVNKYSGKSVFVSYSGGPFRVQLPKMGLPFGVGKFTNPDTGDTKYSLDLSMKDIEPKVIENFQKIEEAIIDYAEKNSVELFKKKRSKEILKEFYKSFIKFHEEDGEQSDKYPPRFKAKLWTTNNDFSCDVFDSVKVDGAYPKIKLNVDNCDEIITGGSHCEAIIQASGIWVVQDSFGISWSVNQLKIYKNANSLSGYSFVEDEDTDTEEPVEEIEAEIENDFDELVITPPEPTKPKTPRRKRDEL
jgi:hypothetical protein